MTYEEPTRIDDDDIKVALCAKLASFGIAFVEIAYDGCGDSGCIVSVQFLGPDNIDVTPPDIHIDAWGAAGACTGIEH